MIASVTGRVAALTPELVVIEVGADYSVGFAVHCTPATLANLHVGHSVRLATSLVVREDSLTLYGFADDAQRIVFELLQTASGVGPRLAQAALAVHSPSALRRAIVGSDFVTLTAVPGIGKKGAQRMVLELAERAAAVSLPGSEALEQSDAILGGAATPEPVWRQQVRQGLLALGWSAKQAEDATALVIQNFEREHAVDAAASGASEPSPDVATMLKAAIAILGRSR